ncbi:tRNA epoxyqueuosine(34) reductase QueG [Paraferrimonas sedimenticola]|uniref:Epoxyqueuosine reductase n=1 Tax=Paraferrimonas sedimenticola TaxID=375674 RepID=A0AA37S084_9GAMM|nr:tRNA epoxyqueuosine(34) reductase QueG [Paraferrimonas sedimenticola]GLP98122.1 epoxyqueuosine reductase [Paraferrimonas sedimenticola]
MTQSDLDYAQIAQQIKAWGKDLGFSDVGIADLDVSQHKAWVDQWLASDYHGSMHYMTQNQDLRLDPSLLQPGSLRAVCVRLDYLPPKARFADNILDPNSANISRYAGGRDYHKMMRNRLKQLGQKIQTQLPQLSFRPFVDSAPVLERPLAEKAGLGWVGKHSLLLSNPGGSWYFLGELLVNLPLPVDLPVANQCGSCKACRTLCPTQAIVDDYVVDARRCISYLTIEHEGAIDESLRSAMGNRIYGCDDCQLACPFNRSSELTEETDFHTREYFQQASLLSLFSWSEQEFLERLQGSPIRRIGHKKWLRNISVALGNAPYDPQIVAALQGKLEDCEKDFLVEHLQWAIEQQNSKKQLLASSPSRASQRLARIVQKGLPRDA